MDNTRGYEHGNVVTACTRCNKAKGRLPVAEFMAWICSLVAQHLSRAARVCR